jgi:pimeloyl-ACP methyl ester carboxylesterase
MSGCASAPERVAALAREAGYARAVVRGAAFEHVVFRSAGHRAGQAHQDEVLHVYIEGDGRPDLDRWTVAADPTPRNPLMLRLMALDPQRALYLGRPCYFGLATEPPCTPLDWTLDRFGERVVASLAQALAEIRRGRETVPVELYGHSGGGALAVLLAQRVPGVRRVVTLAGNLDPDAWTAYHAYTPLTGSFNPARLGPLPPSIAQQHFAGERDRVVPPTMIEAAAARIGAPPVTRLPAATHTRGWVEAWPAILAGAQGNSNRTPSVNSP